VWVPHLFFVDDAIFAIFAIFAPIFDSLYAREAHPVMRKTAHVTLGTYS
jgi:hypothetical protein